MRNYVELLRKGHLPKGRIFEIFEIRFPIAAAAGLGRQAIGIPSRSAPVKRIFCRRIVIRPITESWDTAHLGNDVAMTAACRVLG
jgi:hypothetical protein